MPPADRSARCIGVHRRLNHFLAWLRANIVRDKSKEFTTEHTENHGACTEILQTDTRCVRAVRPGVTRDRGARTPGTSGHRSGISVRPRGTPWVSVLKTFRVRRGKFTSETIDWRGKPASVAQPR